MTKSIYLLPLLIILLQSCIRDIEPEIPNEEELITTVKVALTPINGGETKIFLFQDIDGDGGIEPFIETDTLESGTLYSANLELYNEQFSPALDITEEIIEEGADHQFFFITENNSMIFQYVDEDVNGKPIGLQFQIQTTTNSEDIFTLTLRHEPDKNAQGVSDGNIENAGGETDIAINFQVYVE